MKMCNYSVRRAGSRKQYRVQSSWSITFGNDYKQLWLLHYKDSRHIETGSAAETGCACWSVWDAEILRLTRWDAHPQGHRVLICVPPGDLLNWVLGGHYRKEVEEGRFLLIGRRPNSLFGESERERLCVCLTVKKPCQHFWALLDCFLL